jgi:hypothetical protein
MNTYSNPIIFADYSDPDVVKVGDDYYLTASSFNYTPGLPILHSTDLVSWTLMGYAVKDLGYGYRTPRHSEGIWAPSIRYYNDMFYIYYGMPDEGLFVVRGRYESLISDDTQLIRASSKDVPEECPSREPDRYISDQGVDLKVPHLANKRIIWDAPICVLEGKGLIDPCPFIDDDGRFYLVHAYAKSRIGFKSILGMVELDPTGTEVISEDRFIFNGGLVGEDMKEDLSAAYKGQAKEEADEKKAPAVTIEGPKVYKRNGFYYILAPAGGVRQGWQLTLRSESIEGPYECRISMHRGDSTINGPHQGGMVSDEGGDDWFIHFQDMGPYGRVCHLQPLRWTDNWPVIGRADKGDTAGCPVEEYRSPSVKSNPDVTKEGRIKVPFETATDNQWLGNHSYEYYEVLDDKDNVVSKDMADLYHGMSRYIGHSGNRRLKLQALNSQGRSPIIWKASNVLTRKIDRRNVEALVTLDISHLQEGDRAGVAVLGGGYAFLECRITGKDELAVVWGKGIESGQKGHMRETADCIKHLKRSGHKQVTFLIRCKDASADGSDRQSYAKVEDCHPEAAFEYRMDNGDNAPVRRRFPLSDHTWTGAKLGLYAISGRDRGGYITLEEYEWRDANRSL